VLHYRKNNSYLSKKLYAKNFYYYESIVILIICRDYQLLVYHLLVYQLLVLVYLVLPDEINNMAVVELIRDYL